MRAIGLLCGMIPIVQLIVHVKIFQIVDFEVELENEKKLNEKRKKLQICKTKYPIVMVYGVFFRDFKYFNYWRRIPDELEKKWSGHFLWKSCIALSVKGSSIKLYERIKMFLRKPE